MVGALLDVTHQLGGIAWDPHIRSILVVLAGVLLLPGSVYLLLLTNVGSRLGFLLAMGGVFGWIFIHGITWFLLPPAIGPAGENPSWVPVDVVYGDLTASDEETAHDLPNACWSVISRDCVTEDGTTVNTGLIASLPEDEQAELDDDATLSEIAAFDEPAVNDLDFGEWRIIPSSELGEPLAAADAELAEQGIVEGATDYVVLDGWETGGKDPLPDDPSRWDRIWYKIRTTAQVRHPEHLAVVQVIPVVPQETEEGEAPPTPIADTNQPVISVVMVRDLGTLRLPAAMVTLGAGIMLGVIAYALHRRDELADTHRAAEDAEV